MRTRVHWPSTAALTVAMVLAWIGWEFGADIARDRAMTAAIEAFERCAGPEECRQAWAMFEVAKGGR